MSASARLRGASPALAVWLFLSVVTTLPYVRAWTLPPRGTSFLGFFYAIPDVLNYLSYVQQAEDGALVFVNKVAPEPQRPSIVNLEWWLVGKLSVAMGSRPALAYRCFGLLATLALVLAADRWLRAAGLPARHRFAALLLGFTGGGFGGLLYQAFGPPAWRFLDLTTGMYPFIAVLVNPHFVAGTALLLWALWAFHAARRLRGHVLAVLLGSALVVVRPYEIALLIGIRALLIVLSLPRDRWLRAAVPVLCLAPALAFGLLTLVPGFGVFLSPGYNLPPVLHILLALLPAGAVALAVIPSLLRGSTAENREALLLWVAWPVAVGAVLCLPVGFGLQTVTNLGLPLLALVALALARFAPSVTLLVALASCSTGVTALRLLLEDNPNWFVPRERFAAALALRGECRKGETVLAPPDIGLYANAHSSCRAYLGHMGASDAAERMAVVEGFYRGSAAERSASLDRLCIPLVVLTDDGPRAEMLLGDSSAYRRVALVDPVPGRALAVYRRDPRRPCAELVPAASGLSASGADRRGER